MSTLSACHRSENIIRPHLCGKFDNNCAIPLGNASFHFAECLGKVQKVHFLTHKEKATQLHCTGWVQSTERTTVIGCAEGSSRDIQAMKKWLQSDGLSCSVETKNNFVVPSSFQNDALSKYHVLSFEIIWLNGS